MLDYYSRVGNTAEDLFLLSRFDERNETIPEPLNTRLFPACFQFRINDTIGTSDFEVNVCRYSVGDGDSDDGDDDE